VDTLLLYCGIIFACIPHALCTPYYLLDQAYARVIENSMSSPRATLSIVIDGMDQKKTWWPRLKSRFGLEREDQIKFHLIGSIVHGVGFLGQLFNSSKWSRASSNMTITTLARTLVWLQTHKAKRLPPVLHLQLDNCVKENKCNDFYAFLCYLVQTKVFDEVYVSYCVVGHTHLDIDQVFSRLSNALKHGHLTLSEFMRNMSNAYTYMGNKAEIHRCESVCNWGKAIAPHITDAIHGITSPLMFRIKRKGPTVIISYKAHCEKPVWKGRLHVLALANTHNIDTCMQCYQ